MKVSLCFTSFSTGPMNYCFSILDGSCVKHENVVNSATPKWQDLVIPGLSKSVCFIFIILILGSLLFTRQIVLSNRHITLQLIVTYRIRWKVIFLTTLRIANFGVLDPVTFDFYLFIQFSIFWRYINNSLHLAPKYARIFVYRHYLFRELYSFAKAQLKENCELQGTDNVIMIVCLQIGPEIKQKSPDGEWPITYMLWFVFFLVSFF